LITGLDDVGELASSSLPLLSAAALFDSLVLGRSSFPELDGLDFFLVEAFTLGAAPIGTGLLIALGVVFVSAGPFDFEREGFFAGLTHAVGRGFASAR
jgi:hypothetical protein